MIRSLLFVLLLAVAVVIAASFAWLNPGTVQINLVVAEVELMKSQAFVLALALGWLLGALSATLLVVKLMGERRRLRRAVRQAEAETENLRSLPLSDGGR